MIQKKKICMLGAFAVGKTSLVKRFVKSIFDEKYLTTVGVKIDKKTVQVDNREVVLMLWDLEGQDAYHQIRTSYVRGASGYLLVADGTRQETLDDALELRDRVEKEVGRVPFILLLNKNDLSELWELNENRVRPLSEAGIHVLTTSAKTGHNVEEAFHTLAARMLDRRTDGEHHP